MLRVVLLVRSGECHGQPHPCTAQRLYGGQRYKAEAVLFDWLSDRHCRLYDWLGFYFRLDYRPGSKVADGLDQILSKPAADHDPKSDIQFERNSHRASPPFAFLCDSELSTEQFSSIGRLWPIEGCSAETAFSDCMSPDIHRGLALESDGATRRQGDARPRPPPARSACRDLSATEADYQA